MTTTSTTLEALQAFSDRYQHISVREVEPFVAGLLADLRFTGTQTGRALAVCDAFLGYTTGFKSNRAAVNAIVETIERRVMAHQRTKRI
jgi:hypothetical protein